MTTVRVAVVGASGFIGEAVTSECRRRGHAVSPVRAPRIRANTSREHVTESLVEGWIRRNPAQCDAMCGALSGADVVVHAAGLAAPDSNDAPSLFGANAVLPGVVASLSAAVGARRLVHVSSAAVQGRRTPLDESRELAPLSAYALSKAAGETAVQSMQLERPQEVVVYRPTSVQACSRQTTRRLVAFATRRFVPIAGDGELPVPVCTIDSVAAAVAHLVTAPAVYPIVLHPWEGMTTRLLLEAFGDDPAFVSVPRFATSVGARVSGVLGVAAPRLAGSVRRLELLLMGQRQSAIALQASGLVFGDQIDSYRELGRAVRDSRGGRMGQARGWHNEDL